MNAKGIREGMTVYAKDGEKLGKVIACQADHFLIEKGFFFPKDYLARYDEVLTVEADDRIVLDLARSELREAGGTAAWDEETGTAGGRLGQRSASGEALNAGATEETRVPLVEEDVDVEKRMRDAGEVRVRKEVKTEHRRIDVPITKEEVHVERVPASGATPGESSFQPGSVSIPVREEEVEIRKRPVVKEEIRVSKTAKRGEIRADADVRKETAEIEKTGDVERKGDTGLPHLRDPEDE